MAEKQGLSRLLTLTEAAKILGISYERIRVFVTEGRIPTIDVPGIGRVVRREDLERFQETPRPTGRPPALRRRPRESHHAPGSIPDLFSLVEKKTGLRPTMSEYRNLIRAGILPRRRDFLRGGDGKRLCLARQCRLLVPIMRLRQRHVVAPQDLVIGLKWSRYRVPHDLLTRSMLIYLYKYRLMRETLTDDNLEQFILRESYEERPPRLRPRMKRGDREAAYSGLTKIELGRTFTTQDMTMVRDAVGLPKELLPDRNTPGETPDLSWSGVFKGIQEADEKIGRLVDQATIGQQQRGQRQVTLYKPFATPEELDKAWDAARPLLNYLMPSLVEKLHGVSPRARVFYVNATNVKIVTFCLIQLREQGDAAFAPFRGDLAPFNSLWQEAWIHLMVTPPPGAMASLIQQVMISPPKTDIERRQATEKFEEIARSTVLSDRDRRVIDSMLETMKHPSKKKIKRMQATLEAWRAEINRLPHTEVRAE